MQTLATLGAVAFIFALVVTYHYIIDLRTTLTLSKKDAETGWRLYDDAHRELCAIKRQPVSAPYFDKPADTNGTREELRPFKPTTVGPTAINDRELRRERREQEERTPRFTKDALRTPSDAEVTQAVREALSNNGEDRN